MKPARVTLFVFITIAALGVISFLFPAGGIQVGTMTLHFPSLLEILSPDRPDYADITVLQEVAEELQEPEPEPKLPKDTATGGFTNRFSGITELTTRHLEFPEGRMNLLYPFFRKLDSLAHHRRTVRILHYGDSQIEGDRITHILRRNMQSQFGGSGPGLVPVVDLYNSRAVNRELAGSWQRHALFGRKSEVPHNGFGAMASFSRFAPVVLDSVFANDSMMYTASVTFTGAGYPFNQCRVFAGNALAPVSMTVAGPDGILKRDSIGKNLKIVYTYTGASEVTITFSGYDSPDIYGIDLSTGGGVMVDNLAMRGSSGTIFNRMNTQQLRQMYDALDVELFLLQFGGNVMPYIESKEQAVRYGNWFYSQLVLLKRLRPSACIIVMGPSDKSIKEKEHYITYPLLEDVRDALKDATFRAGAVYWDMYEAMGGYNSMPAWVEADPPLAAKDYIHFSPRGARLIGNMFHNALMWEYQQYKNSRK
jgi:hypothetical protein